MKNFHHILFILLIVCTALLFSCSDQLRAVAFKNTQIDTVGHFIGFFCLIWLLTSLAKLPTFPTAISLIIYAALSELGQYYLGYRNGEVKDFIADISAILLFVALKGCWYGVVKKRKQAQ